MAMDRAYDDYFDGFEQGNESFFAMSRALFPIVDDEYDRDMAYCGVGEGKLSNLFR